MLKKFATRIMIAATLLVGTTFPSLATVANSRTGVMAGNYKLAEGYKHTFSTIAFRRGEWASITVSGDGYSDLDVYVYDRAGNLVAADDEEFSDECFTQWVPSYTGIYTIVVINRGDTYDNYYFEAS